MIFALMDIGLKDVPIWMAKWFAFAGYNLWDLKDRIGIMDGRANTPKSKCVEKFETIALKYGGTRALILSSATRRPATSMMPKIRVTGALSASGISSINMRHDFSSMDICILIIRYRNDAYRK